MRQRRKVQILASTRKKQREGITWVADNQEAKANHKSKGNNNNNNNNSYNFGHSNLRIEEGFRSISSSLESV
ncbi:MAG: hypothetical protein M3261_08370 [Thermoproteota archaeon]|nr:hypothetical protein [Thermoproteota archaeon]